MYFLPTISGVFPSLFFSFKLTSASARISIESTDEDSTAKNNEIQKTKKLNLSQNNYHEI